MHTLETHPQEPFRTGTSHLETLYNRFVKMNNGAILFCIKGEADITIDLKQYHIIPYTKIILLTGCMFSLVSANKDFEVHFFAYSEEMANVASFRLSPTFFYFLKRNPCFNHTDEKKIFFIKGLMEATDIIFADKKNNYRNIIAQNLLQIFFLDTYDKVQRYSNPVHTGSNNRKEELFKRFIQLVHTYCMQKREVTFYADKLCISTRYLSAITQEMGANSAKKIINDMLILELKVALKSTALPLKEIADKFHFPDQSFLGRYFKKYAGMSPKKFRMQKI